MSFITKVAQFVKEKEFSPETLHIIVPSDRAIHQIRRALLQQYTSPVFAPEIISIDRWMRPDTHTLVDRTRQLILLYETCLDIEHFKDQSFEEFLPWATTLLQDFNEIHRYMLDAESVFKNLKSIKELESWQIDEEELSDSQLKFRAFWEQIPKVYSSFHDRLNERNQMSSGWAYREFANHLSSYICMEEGHHYVFAGFNALSVSELSVVQKLLSSQKAHFLTDGDHFYTDDPVHEAGTFIRKNHEYLQLGYEIPQNRVLEEKKMDVHIIECAQHIAQVKVVSSELHRLSEEELNKTLVLLCDESLITAVAKNIPSNVKKANITLGLPLTQTAVKSWVDLLFQVQENKSKFSTDAVYFYDLQRWVNHSFTIGCLSLKELDELGSVEQDSIKKNRVFQSKATLKKTPLISAFTDLVFESWGGDWTKAIQNIRALNALVIERLSEKNRFERRLMEVFDESLIEFERIIQEGIPVMSQKSFKLFFDQHWIRQNIAFKGDPSDGLQVMGLLESRMLDFERIMAIGMNEGKLPATNTIDSFIPMDLRAALGLPTTREKQGVFAHHLYRLLHSCSYFIATYCTNHEQLGAQEKSRYLLQLELELNRMNENLDLHKSYYNIPFTKASRSNAQRIEKSSLVMGRIENYFTHSISASSLNTYLKCPLDFYYKYIAELGEEKSIEEDIESQQFGSLIHNTLEKLYEKHALFDAEGNEHPGRGPLKPKDIEKMMETYKALLYDEFLSYFDQDASLFLEGKNVLSYTIAQDTVENMLKKELEFIHTQKDPVYIVQVEPKKTVSLDINIKGETRKINFSGYIDRIDRVGNAYRVIDYKSGRVSDKHVQLKLNKNGVVASFSNCKHAVQLALYSLFFKESYGAFPEEAMIYSLTDVTKLEYPLSYEKHELKDICSLFIDFLEEVMNDIFDESVPLEHTEDSDYCHFCL